MNHYKSDINEGLRLKKIFDDKHISVTDFAPLFGINRINLYRYFKQERIKSKTLNKFCEILGISIDEFYSWGISPGKNSDIPPPIHQGSILEDIIETKGFNITKISQRIGITRNTLYKYFKREKLDDEVIEHIAKKLSISPSIFYISSNDNAQNENDPVFWKEKYYALLEEHTKLLRQINIKNEQL